MIFLLLCFIIYFKKYMNNSSYLLSTFSHNNYKSVCTGNDERYSINDTNNGARLYLLHDNSSKPINLTSSGLTNDFNFQII